MGMVEFSIEDFINEVKHLKVSKPYYFLLLKFSDYLEEEKGKSLDNFTVEDVRHFIMELDSTGSAKVFLNAIRKYLQIKIQVLTQSGKISVDRYFALSSLLDSLYNLRIRKEDLQIRKKALTIEELATALKLAKSNSKYIRTYLTLVINFYFGARPLELTKYFAEGEINFDERYIIIKNAKRPGRRYLVWHPIMDRYVESWRKLCETYIANLKYPQDWITKQYKRINRALGLNITARTGRATFETYMRKYGVEQWKIDYLLGHATKVPDIYTDATMILNELREVMGKKHYMILNREILGIA